MSSGLQIACPDHLYTFSLRTVEKYRWTLGQLSRVECKAKTQSMCIKVTGLLSRRPAVRRAISCQFPLFICISMDGRHTLGNTKEGAGRSRVEDICYAWHTKEKLFLTNFLFSYAGKYRCPQRLPLVEREIRQKNS